MSRESNNGVIIIAEAGVNHNGSLEKAKELIDVAAQSGADYIKFQTFKAELSISKVAKKANYQAENTSDSEESQLDMVKKLEIAFEDHHRLISYCRDAGIKFLSTGLDPKSLSFLHGLDLDLVKIPSGEINNQIYLEQVGTWGKPTLLSTGMSNLADIERALNILYASGTERSNVTVLHCNTEYPTPFEDVNLKAMNTIGQAFGVKIGYSDHTMGIEVPIAAVALGATVIEKHFTLDRNLPGPDHKASLEPQELKSMVSAIRNIEQAISGSGLKEPSASERGNTDIARKSIHLKQDMPCGTAIEKGHLIMTRPGNGISPLDYRKVLGMAVNKDTKAGQILNWEDLKPLK